MFCNQCGNQLNDNACFCGKCGAKVAILKEEIADSVPPKMESPDTPQPSAVLSEASQPDTAQDSPGYSLTISYVKRRFAKTKIVLNGIEQEPPSKGETRTYRVDNPMVDLRISAKWYSLCWPLHLKLRLQPNAYIEFTAGHDPQWTALIGNFFVLTDFSGVTVIE